MVMTAEETLDERDLIEKIISGDRSAFKTLVDSCGKRVINLCYKFTGNRMDAEDIAQDVFVEVYKNINRFRGDSSLMTWILRIANNRSLNYLRDNKRRTGISLDSQRSENGGTLADTIPGKSSDRPDRDYEIRRNSSLLYEAITRLPEKYSKPFALHKLDGMPYAEIAKLLGISLSAVESRIHRARKRLQNDLAKTLKM